LLIQAATPASAPEGIEEKTQVYGEISYRF
jgi:hypothetical protein